MPLPMVHLSVAVRLFELRGREPSPAFLLGSLAPDAIHMRPDATPDDKRRVHFRAEEAAGDRDAVIAAVWAAACNGGPAAADQAAGYIAHLFTDYDWTAGHVRPQQARMAADGHTPAEVRATYYRETDQIDFDLFNGRPWRPRVWELLAAARAADMPGLLAAGEIAAWQQRTLHWFSETLPEPGIQPAYFSLATVSAFIDDTAAALAADWAHWWPGDGA